MQIQYKYLDLVKKVFNYYNGRINPNIPAVLEIYTTPPIGKISSDNLGNAEYPNIISIELYNICVLNEGYEIDIVYDIIFSIIHELYHVEHLANIHQYNSDEAYNNRVEETINFMTATYMINHLIEIKNVFNLTLTENMIGYLKQLLYAEGVNVQDGFTLYERRSKQEYVSCFISYIYTVFGDFNDTVQQVSSTLEQRLYLDNSIVTFIINGNSILIKDKNYYVPMQTFNNWMHQFDTLLKIVQSLKLDLFKTELENGCIHYKYEFTFEDLEYITMAKTSKARE